MNSELINAELLESARQLRNQKAKEWRKRNPEKVKDINLRYWVKQAKKLQVQNEGGNKDGNF